MKRKVVQHGPATLIVSLPSDWAKRNNVKKGDEVEVEDKGKSLMITTESARSDSKISADVSGLRPYLVTRFLTKSYQKGYDSILLKHSNVKILGAVQNKVHELIGYEILEQDDEICLIQSISKKIDMDFDNSLRKSFLIVREMMSTLLEDYENQDSEALNNLYLKDLEVNRLTSFCLRRINKEFYSDPEKIDQRNNLYLLIDNLESLGDCCKRLARRLAKTKRKSKDIVSLMKLMIKTYDVAYNFFYKATEELANECFDLNLKITNTIETFTNNNPQPEEVMTFPLVNKASSLIYSFTTTRLDFIQKYETNN
uniref:Phosphate uptake regulator n=1 Tax=uncultured marine group II/III euryarchaeote KM3_83_G03 TaxID=1456522 RepID=A0A075HT58_9EURY|nr:phosphate uptake regulator [uncultured marine group II/III euryarchaeote KM3_83_G03]